MFFLPTYKQDVVIQPIMFFTGLCLKAWRGVQYNALIPLTVISLQR